MGPGDERVFPADDPVARYWLHNCVGFGVRGFVGGVVEHVGVGPDGLAVLAVRRPVLGTTLVSASRVESVDPWDETIVLRSRERETPPRGAEQASQVGHAIASGGRAAAILAAVATRRFLTVLARLLRALAARVRTHAPVARRYVGSAAASLAAMGAAYTTEARRAYRAQRDAVDTWREERRRGDWGDDAPITRAGADEVDAREEERVPR